MLIPHPISDTETIASVAAGGTFGLLLTESGKVYTCGYGALGLGRDKIQVLMPEQITSLSGIRKIVASTDQAAAIDGKHRLSTCNCSVAAVYAETVCVSSNASSPSLLR